jgi:hypothetical protein
MFNTLVKDLVLVSDVFKDTEFDSITEEEFEMFLKEAVFEKLKGKKLGEIFAEKFGVKDRVLSIYRDDRDIIQHIRHCRYVK